MIDYSKAEQFNTKPFAAKLENATGGYVTGYGNTEEESIKNAENKLDDNEH